MPCQVETLSRYADGSLRAVMVVFLSPLAKDKGLTYTLEFGEGLAGAAGPISGNLVAAAHCCCNSDAVERRGQP